VIGSKKSLPKFSKLRKALNKYDLSRHAELVSASHKQGVQHDGQMSCGILKQVQDDFEDRFYFLSALRSFATSAYHGFAFKTQGRCNRLSTISTRCKRAQVEDFNELVICKKAF
jgi:hypothetical protein